MVAAVGKTGALAFRVAYGEARHLPAKDINGDGKVDKTDTSLAGAALNTSVGQPGYNPDADWDRDGRVTSADLAQYGSAAYATALPQGQLAPAGGAAQPAAGDTSAAANAIRAANARSDFNIGYCGYRFNGDIGAYTVRFRHYDPTPGMCRWLERDPAGYQDGPSLYSYLGRNPMAGTDPYGLESQVLMLQVIRALQLQKRAQGRIRFTPGRNVDGGFQLQIDLEDEEPTLVKELGVIQLVRWHGFLEGTWDVDDGRVGGLSDPSPDPPYYDNRVPVRQLGPPGHQRGRAVGRYTLADTPWTWDHWARIGFQRMDFIVIVVATKGPAEGHVYGVFHWTWPLGDPDNAPMRGDRVITPWYPGKLKIS